ncbi:hypothetical protein UFOVP1071_196 [uncultured Caudovirales phage]|uniref:Collagen triple helix repeat n=1 Tax=uncultured Caudovirales phage TaxID=2100421 RepID=A0A6J5QMR4_9CAUD|nr:hypothetical protein UFOVP1071_196 [uncultured Caudovirales phage]
MAIKIRLPYSNSTGVTPTAINLLTGELAVNTADAKLWVKHSDGTLKLITATGAQGAQGLRGTQGPTGNTGPLGFPGPQGGQGTQGAQGTNSAVQGPAGFPGRGGPQGATGPQSAVAGPQGATGPQGVAQGPAGFAGPAGLLGAQGAQGTQGPQSLVRGTQGPAGPAGPTGFTGRTGLTGAPGTYLAPPPVGGDGTGTTCFLGSSYTTMADGSRKMMRDVRVGDWLMGAFGEANQVLASEDLTLGDRPMFVINYTHHTTGDHPHVTPDRKFVAIEPDEVFKEWGQWYNCELADGSFVMLNNVGFDDPEEKVKDMHLGNTLQTIDGPKTVECIESYYLPPETKLYNFVMSGSHTYSADGYFVTGWPRDDDFDYIEWKQIGETSKVEDWMEIK